MGPGRCSLGQCVVWLGRPVSSVLVSFDPVRAVGPFLYDENHLFLVVVIGLRVVCLAFLMYFTPSCFRAVFTSVSLHLGALSTDFSSFLLWREE